MALESKTQRHWRASLWLNRTVAVNNFVIYYFVKCMCDLQIGGQLFFQTFIYIFWKVCYFSLTKSLTLMWWQNVFAVSPFISHGNMTNVFIYYLWGNLNVFSSRFKYHVLKYTTAVHNKKSYLPIIFGLYIWSNLIYKWLST